MEDRPTNEIDPKIMAGIQQIIDTFIPRTIEFIKLDKSTFSNGMVKFKFNGESGDLLRAADSIFEEQDRLFPAFSECSGIEIYNDKGDTQYLLTNQGRSGWR